MSGARRYPFPMNLQTVIAVIAAVAIAVLATQDLDAAGQDSAAEGNRLAFQSEAMILKMMQAQVMLEGLALGDYERIRTSAEELRRLSIDAQWGMGQSRDYGAYGEEFRTALNRIIEQTEAKNLEGATLHFNQVVMTCVQCHKAIRDRQRTASMWTGDRFSDATLSFGPAISIRH